MHQYPRHIGNIKTQQTINRPISQIYGFSKVASTSKQSQVNNFNSSPYLIHPSQRISTVSSQKMSIATRVEPYSNTTMGISLTPKSSIIVGNNSSRKVFNPHKEQRNNVIQNSPLINSSYRNSQHSRSLSQHQLQIGVAYGIPSFSQQIINPYLQTQVNPYRQSTFTNNFLNKSLETSLIVSKQLSAKQPVINPSPVNKQTTLPVQKIKQSNRIESQNKSTVVQSGSPIIGNVTVQNIQLPPKIRNATRQNNRLYKSAVFGGNNHSPRPASRTHSTFSHQGKTKKRDVYIRRPHRTFISDKKIPIIGGYVSNDKSKRFVLRQMSGIKCPKVLTSKVLTMQLIDVIPTQVIKIPIGKAQQLRQSQANSSMMILDDNHSISSNPIIDQPTLIKQYSPEKSVRSYYDNRNDSLDQSFYSNRSKRLGDNIKISVYRSPDVIVKKAEIITSGPKLTKHHILRVAAEGKVVSPQKYQDLYKKQKSDSSKKSLSPTAKYEYESNQYNILSKTLISNPYVKKETNDIEQRVKNEVSSNRQNLHITAQNSSAFNPITKIAYPQTIQTPIKQSPINLIQSNLSSSFKKVEPLFSTSNFIFQQIQQRIKNQQTKTTIQTNQLIESNHLKQQKFNIDYQRTDQNVKNIFQEPLNNLFEIIGQQYRKQSSNTELFEFQQTLRYLNQSQRYETSLNLQNMNKHQYKIPQLSEDLQQDLRILKAQNERNRKQNNLDFSQKWSEDILHY